MYFKDNKNKNTKYSQYKIRPTVIIDESGRHSEVGCGLLLPLETKILISQVSPCIIVLVLSNNVLSMPTF